MAQIIDRIMNYLKSTNYNGVEYKYGIGEYKSVDMALVAMQRSPFLLLLVAEVSLDRQPTSWYHYNC
ncbi:MAG: hypothetical protein AAB296_06430 [Candidatus Desantisbacteria bacterium]